jgi:hypothetical protein
MVDVIEGLAIVDKERSDGLVIRNSARFVGERMGTQFPYLFLTGEQRSPPKLRFHGNGYLRYRSPIVPTVKALKVDLSLKRMY